MPRLLVALPLFTAIILAIVVSPDTTPPAHAAQKGKAKAASADDAAARVTLAEKGLKLDVWAAEPLFANPVAFNFDGKGRCFIVETFRHTQGVPDTRGKPWLDDDLACRTVADRVAMYKKYNFPQYPENSERVRLVWDSDGDGKADKDTVFADGFNRYEDGIAAGVLAHKDSVYFACIPDLYLLKEDTRRGTNKASVKQSLATGFGIHVQFIGHDLHGLIMGPDGKLYMSIGDRGFNITTKEGKKLFNPDSGAVLRCNPDGSNLEVVHIGLRNPQELAFDDHGNLFTWDNNSDSGDRARWVYVVEGGDSGWRCGFQYGTGYHTPDVPQGNRGPWNTEKLWIPQWDGQPTYIVPPLLNFGNGPSGIAHYPGIGLNDKYKDHFFCTDFTGGPGGGSAIWSLSVKPKGAAFEVVEPTKFVTNMLPTDCEFGPDGAFYWSDWTTGWDKPGKGRIFRLTDPEAMKNPAVGETKKLLAEGFEKKTVEELAKLLEFPHQKVRQEAQFELAGRGRKSRSKGDSGPAGEALIRVLKDSKNRLARLHAIWGLGMIPAEPRTVQSVVAALKDPDAEVRKNAVKVAGRMKDAEWEHLGEGVGRKFTPVPPGGRTEPKSGQIVELLTDPDLAVRAAAAEAYVKLILAERIQIGVVTPGSDEALFNPLFDLLKSNNDKDPYVRHAAVMGLAHAVRNPADLWNPWKQKKGKYDTPAVRMGVLLALRKHGSDLVAEFLSDAEPRIVAEAARAVYDERVMTGFETLAKLADTPGLTDATAFRAIAANFWLGTPEAAARVAKFAGRTGEPDYTRAFALDLLGKWGVPGRRDPITGITMSLENRNANATADAIKSVGVAVFSGSDVVRRSATQAVSKLGIKEFGPAMAALVKDAKQPLSLRVEALHAVEALKDDSAKELSELALGSTEPKLRAAGRAVKAKLEPTAVLKELPALLKDDKVSVAEKQGAFAILANQRASEETDKLLDEWLDLALAGKVPQEIVLDVLDAAETRANTPKLKLSAPLKAKVDQYRAAQAKRDDKLASYLESLAGGDAEKGRNIFLNNSAVYCQRCHKLDGQGGEVGPQLNGLAADKEKDRRYLLESIVQPSAKIAKGYDTVILLLTDETTVSGVIKSEDKKVVRLVTPENKEIVVKVEDIDRRRTGPSAMPDDLHKKLTRRELRDVVEFLASLKEPPKK